MTAVFSATISAPVTVTYTAAPLSVQAADYRAALAAGAVAVDLRDATTRATDGAFVGALAVPADQALALLSPDSPGRLRTASRDARWILISDDGYDAEMLAWHLQARGVIGARFVVGGLDALAAAGISEGVGADALGLYDAH